MEILSGLSYTHLVSPMPEVYRKEKYVPRGVSNRRAALQWVQENGEDTGVLYFLDDDNAIDIRLFNEMRSTETVSMWPVGLIGEYTVSSPVVKGEEEGAGDGAGDDEDVGLEVNGDVLEDVQQF
ncbi:Galactosylgalactosylxylosylprotein 3-beta-glucuronosyltransferase S [Portunus trituberculatus]|uniref:Galactosylgalactosylxylosylprotein 3-beta-glucuronosyltransferase n=1 Tax=Portunus trituberculatus TaxID=210409 RepID=A0A5B7DV44_PORTR|nr:Galactosylgalactosylxylosylprotein 3-beta-glucuronosyltransferase S [Portunus trituberculatus]